MPRYTTLLFLSLAATADAAIDYVKQIQPLWAEHCSDCHSGADSDGELDMDTHAALMKGGKAGAALAPGKAQDSLLVKFLEGRSGKTGKNQFMPPGKREHLSGEQIKLVRQWIDEGAKGPAASDKPVDPLASLPKVAAQTKLQPIHAAASSADGKLLALGRYGACDLLSLSEKKLLRTITGVKGKVAALAFSADGGHLFLAAGEAGVSGIAYQVKVADGSVVRSFAGHGDALYALAVAPDGKTLATGGYDQKIKLWDIATGAEKSVLKGHNGCVNGLAFRPDGAVLASASADRTVKLWDGKTGGRLDTFSQPTKEQLMLAFSHDGKHLVAGGVDNRLRIWSISPKATEGSNALEATKFAHEGAVLFVSFSPDGKTLLSTASDRTVKTWDVMAGYKAKAALELQSDWVNAAAWSGNEAFIVARQDGSTGVYSANKPSAAMPLIAAAMPAKRAAAKAAKKKPTPVTFVVEPRGFQIGSRTLLQVTGAGLGDIKQATLGGAAGVAVKVVESKTEVQIEITAPPSLARGNYTLTLTPFEGAATTTVLLADDLPLHTAVPIEPITAPSQFLGILKNIGQQDKYPFFAKKGQDIILDIAAKSLASKAETIQLEVFDSKGARLAFNRGLDSGTDPLLAFHAPAEGNYVARVSETTLDGSAEHRYRLTVGVLPYVTGLWPMAVQAGKATKVNLVGYNLPEAQVTVTAEKPNEKVMLAAPATLYRTRLPLQVQATAETQIEEKEPNDALGQANAVSLPLAYNGLLDQPSSGTADGDLVRFHALKGQNWIIETRAQQDGSPADTKVEMLHLDGRPVEAFRLRALRDSWINFRSVDANNPDIRLEYWREMDLNDYVYLNGDVMRIFRNPRGPDAGFLFFNEGGKRMSYFNTTATGHALDEVAYIVEPMQPGEQPVPNGLPIFSVPYANDDDGERKLGRDSKLQFSAPADGDYLVRVSDSRGWNSPRQSYRLIIREPKPDFTLTLKGTDKQSIPAGGSMGFSLRADRQDGLDEAVSVSISGLPAGWFASSPVIIEAGQRLATGSLHAEAGAAAEADFSNVKVVATAQVGGKPVTKPVMGFGKPMLGAKPGYIAHLEPSVNDKPLPRPSSQPQEITLTPGQSVSCFIHVERNSDKGLLNFDVHNLPFGVIVDNIGLNGVQVREGEDLREIFLTAAKWVPEQDRLVHVAAASARAEQASEGLLTSYPVLLKIRKAGAVAQK